VLHTLLEADDTHRQISTRLEVTFLIALYYGKGCGNAIKTLPSPPSPHFPPPPLS
jgi:hypothetical protein